MQRRWLAPVLACTLILTGCFETGKAPDLVDTDCRRFTVGGKPVRMSIPKGSAIEEDASRGSVLIRPNPNGRMVRFLSLAPQAGLTLSPPERSATLANGLTISYAIDDESGGGSGGAEEELSGEMLLDERTPLIFVCHDQGELSRNAEWCLDHLGTLEPETSPQACR